MPLAFRSGVVGLIDANDLGVPRAHRYTERVINRHRHRTVVVAVFWRRLDGMFPLASVTITEQSVRPVAVGMISGSQETEIMLATLDTMMHDGSAWLLPSSDITMRLVGCQERRRLR